MLDLVPKYKMVKEIFETNEDRFKRRNKLRAEAFLQFQKTIIESLISMQEILKETIEDGEEYLEITGDDAA